MTFVRTYYDLTSFITKNKHLECIKFKREKISINLKNIFFLFVFLSYNITVQLFNCKVQLY